MPVSNKTRYQIELLCDYPEWWRYNVYIMAVGFDEEGGNGTFNNFVNKVYDANYGGMERFAPVDYKTPRTLKLTTEMCVFVEIYVYVVANTFPQSEVVGDSPSFETTLRVSNDGRQIDEQHYEINQWGGLTVVAHRVDAFQS